MTIEEILNKASLEFFLEMVKQTPQKNAVLFIDNANIMFALQHLFKKNMNINYEKFVLYCLGLYDPENTRLSFGMQDIFSSKTAMDYEKFVLYCLGRYDLENTEVVVFLPGESNDENKNFDHKLQDDFGFTIVRKAGKIIKKSNKCNLDVEVSFELSQRLVYNLAFKKFFLVSGDSDFIYLMKKARDHKRQVDLSIISTRKSIAKEYFGLVDDDEIIIIDEQNAQYFLR